MSAAVSQVRTAGRRAAEVATSVSLALTQGEKAEARSRAMLLALVLVDDVARQELRRDQPESSRSTARMRDRGEALALDALRAFEQAGWAA